MQFRYTKKTDLESIDRIWKEHYNTSFGLPNLENVIIHGVVEDEDKGSITGFGLVKIFAEGILILHKSLSARQKVDTLRELMTAQRLGIDRANIGQVHAFIQDPTFEYLLKKHYGYKDTVGKCIVMETK